MVWHVVCVWCVVYVSFVCYVVCVCGVYVLCVVWYVVWACVCVARNVCVCGVYGFFCVVWACVCGVNLWWCGVCGISCVFSFLHFGPGKLWMVEADEGCANQEPPKNEDLSEQSQELRLRFEGASIPPGPPQRPAHSSRATLS